MLDTDYLHDGTAIVTDADMPNVRWIVWQDENPESPNDWHTDTAYVFRTSYRGNTDGPGGELSEVFYRVYSEDHDEDIALKVTRRYARIILGWSPERADDGIVTYSALGYSQSDWWDILVISEEGYAESHAQTWEQWARGDVYVVMEEWHDGEEWETVNDQGVDTLVVGGFYAEDPEDAVTQYRQVA